MNLNPMPPPWAWKSDTLWLWFWFLNWIKKRHWRAAWRTLGHLIDRPSYVTYSINRYNCFSGRLEMERRRFAYLRKILAKLIKECDSDGWEG